MKGLVFGLVNNKAGKFASCEFRHST